MSIYVRFPNSKKVEIWPVNDEHCFLSVPHGENSYSQNLAWRSHRIEVAKQNQLCRQGGRLLGQLVLYYKFYGGHTAVILQYKTFPSHINFMNFGQDVACTESNEGIG